MELSDLFLIFLFVTEINLEYENQFGMQQGKSVEHIGRFFIGKTDAAEQNVN